MKKILLYVIAAIIMSPAVNAEPKPVAKSLTAVVAEKIDLKKKKPKTKKRKPQKGPKKIR